MNIPLLEACKRGPRCQVHEGLDDKVKDHGIKIYGNLTKL